MIAQDLIILDLNMSISLSYYQYEEDIVDAKIINCFNREEFRKYYENYFRKVEKEPKFTLIENYTYYKAAEGCSSEELDGDPVLLDETVKEIVTPITYKKSFKSKTLSK